MELGTLQRMGPRTDLGEVKKVSDTKSAAREFEALLIGQLMNSAFSAESMGLSGEVDSGGQTMLDFGREHLSRVIAAWPNLPEPIRRAVLALVAAGTG